MSTRFAYQYVVLRCVPRPDREEFLNVGVVLHCQAADFLGAMCHVDAERLRALHPGIDVDQVRDALAFVELVCRGDERAGEADRECENQDLCCGHDRAPPSGSVHCSWTGPAKPARVSATSPAAAPPVGKVRVPSR